MKLKSTIEKVINVDIVVTVTYTVEPTSHGGYYEPDESGVEIEDVTMLDKAGHKVDVSHLLTLEDEREIIEQAEEEAMGGRQGEHDEQHWWEAGGE